MEVSRGMKVKHAVDSRYQTKDSPPRFNVSPVVASSSAVKSVHSSTKRHEHMKPQQVRLRAIRTKTSRHKTIFFPAATGLINKARDPHLSLTLIPPPRLNSVLH
ncbi:unnamed protein product [Pleuronectes platessa]|uniref:Uncharacterized protein n=1 Tax=Pleuronectes platessa TaxID=8262 RepID=A0A9N7UUG7_PLEPL|nr:unnamed protein product [Pleuronectes platessa]